jgi:predicted Rossmann fold flavoprotein
MEWFSSRGVDLKIEQDNRVFPVSDSSQTIIDCLLGEARKLGVTLLLKQSLQEIGQQEEQFILKTAADQFVCKRLILASGSHPSGHQFAAQFGHTIVAPVPSLFTFNIPDSGLKDLAGISVPHGHIQIEDSNFSQEGPILITHWGLSGPAVLKLSAWGARLLHDRNYQTKVAVNWIYPFSKTQAYETMLKLRTERPAETLGAANPFQLAKNLWRRLLELSNVDEKSKLSAIGNKSFDQLSYKLAHDLLAVQGKTTYKEEFVTCGGVALREVNFKTMESNLMKGLYFAGEILDVDGITGGFNFQNGWTTGWLAGRSACNN